MRDAMAENESGNPSRAEPDWPPVVVGSAYYSANLLMRDLSRRGVQVCCVDVNSDQPAFRSVYGKAYVCPNPDDRPAEWVEFMTSLAAKFQGKPVFIPSGDMFVTALARHARELAEHYTFHESAVALQAKLATKEEQYALAAECDMPISRTRYAETEQDVEDFAASARFPCLLKPLHSREWEAAPSRHPYYCQKLVTETSAEGLLAAYREAAKINPKVVLQEVIEGPDTAKVVYLSCYGRDGKRLASFVVRELRCWPIHYGSASVVEPVDDPEADAVCDRFLRGVGYVGLCEIELKRDTRDSRIKMIEANPRYTMTSDAAPYAGVDLGWIHYLDLIGRDVAPVHSNGRDFRHINLLRDVSCLASYRQAGLETWGSILRSYRAPRAFFDFDPRDWKVTATVLKRLVRIVAGQTYRKVFPKRPAR